MTLADLMELRERAQNLFYFCVMGRRKNHKLLWLIFKHKINTKFFAIKRVRHNGKYKFFANKI